VFEHVFNLERRRGPNPKTAQKTIDVKLFEENIPSSFTEPLKNLMAHPLKDKALQNCPYIPEMPKERELRTLTSFTILNGPWSNFTIPPNIKT